MRNDEYPLLERSASGHAIQVGEILGRTRPLRGELDLVDDSPVGAEAVYSLIAPFASHCLIVGILSAKQFVAQILKFLVVPNISEIGHGLHLSRWSWTIKCDALRTREVRIVGSEGGDPPTPHGCQEEGVIGEEPVAPLDLMALFNVFYPHGKDLYSHLADPLRHGLMGSEALGLLGVFLEIARCLSGLQVKPVHSFEHHESMKNFNEDDG